MQFVCVADTTLAQARKDVGIKNERHIKRSCNMVSVEYFATADKRFCSRIVFFRLVLFGNIFDLLVAQRDLQDYFVACMSVQVNLAQIVGRNILLG